MTELIMFILTVFGLSYLIVSAEIFSFRDKIKNKFITKLINCQTCTSFWISLGIHFIFPITSVCIISAIVGMAAVELINRVTSV